MVDGRSEEKAAAMELDPAAVLAVWRGIPKNSD
jgi:hypothetical protein